jgi:hypothetical protein
LFPFIEEDNRYKHAPDLFKDIPPEKLYGEQFSQPRIGLYLCPSDSSPAGADGVAARETVGGNVRVSYASNYAANYLVFGDVINGRLEGAARIPPSRTA